MSNKFTRKLITKETLLNRPKIKKIADHNCKNSQKSIVFIDGTVSPKKAKTPLGK
jgi:hypothetical protein